MSNHDLGEALLKLGAIDLAAVPEAKAQARRVLDRDRRRVRWLSLLALAVTVLAEALILGGLVAYGFVFPRQALLMQEIEAGKVDAARRDAIQREILVMFEKSTMLVAFSVAVMAQAGLIACLLLAVSRRATLRQINFNLVEITDQLKQLRPPHPAGPPGSAAATA